MTQLSITTGCRRLALAMLAWGMAGCSDAPAQTKQADQQGPGQQRGVLEGLRVSGLDYATPTSVGRTDDEGQFAYRAEESVSFSIGDLELGAAKGSEKLSLMALVAQAGDAEDKRVVNRVVLLQTLDEDGDLNNGIHISAEISAIVSKHHGDIDFDLAPADFAKDAAVSALLEALNASDVFTDKDPRARRLRAASAALETFARASAERKKVQTHDGELSGFAANASTWQWLGIPYGKPPLDGLRWKPTEAPAPWGKPRDAVAWGDQAPQDPRYESSGEGGMSEDCLYLNVTAPRDARSLPVMVWFHGGAFTILTGNTRGYNNVQGLTTNDVVLVTVNHRLGPFGYLNHPLLVEDSAYGGSGNYGQMDLVRSLEWVKQNIAAFGGDPENVTIFGQSGGCGKVAMLMISPMAKGLFHKAVCQSGTNAIPSDATNESLIATAEEVGKALFTRIGASSVAQARALPWTAIVQADIDNNIPRETYRPAIDNHYLSKTLYDSIRDGQENDVPLMIGATNGDYPRLRSGLREVMPFRAAHSKSKIYVYEFSRVPAGWADRGILCGHACELPYLFDHPPMFVNNYLYDLVQDPTTGMRAPIADLNGDGVSGTDGDAADILGSVHWDESDSDYALKVMTIWSNFAKTGDPSTPDLKWTPYTPDSDTYVEFGLDKIEVKTGLVRSSP
jgi:para-nitrobenzyl esterase